jgi:sn-glycerol 3-phosphate transport system substrate-binding protein
MSPTRRAARRRPAPIVIVALGGAVLLAACGSGQSILTAGNDDPPAAASTVTPTVGPTQPGDTAAPVVTTIPPTTTTTPLDSLPACPVDALASATAPVEITFWHGMNGGLEDALVALTDAYNATQSKVRVQLENQGGYEQTIDKYLQSRQDSRPALVQFPEYQVQAIVDTGSAIPMGACIEAAGYDTSAFLPRALSAYGTEGVQWSMPFNVSNPVLYYNKKLFRDAGLDPEKPPLTIEELRSMSQQIVDSGAATYGIAFDTGADSGGGWFLEQWFAKLGELYSDNNNGRLAPSTRVLYDGPRGVELMSSIQSLITDGLAVNVGDNPSGQDSLLKLADRQAPAAMTIVTSAALGTVISVVDGGLIPGITSADIGVGAMPGPAGAPGVLIGGASLWIVAEKADAESAAAWDYVSYLVSAESQSTWAVATGYVPVRSDAATRDPLSSTFVSDPRFKVAFDQVSAPVDAASSVGPILGPLREVRSVTALAVATILNGGDVQQALTASAADANALIADYTARNG